MQSYRLHSIDFLHLFIYMQGSINIFEALSWKFFHSQPYNRWINMKTWGRYVFLAHRTICFSSLLLSQFISWNYSDWVEKYEKYTLRVALKIHFQRIFASSFLHLMSNGLNGVNINLLMYVDCSFVINFSVAYLAKAQNHLISSNTT